MEGLILAAGLGTRLRPLTNDRPKALVEVEGHTLLEICIHRMAAAGAKHCVVNIHHFAPMMREYIATREWPCRVSISDESDMLLDTGGALRHAAPLFSGHDTVLVHNVDVLSSIDLKSVVTQHDADGNMATLCASRRDTGRPLLFDKNGQLTGRANTNAESNITKEEHGQQQLAFSGITAINPALFALLPNDDHPYPIIDEYIRLSHEGHRIMCLLHQADQWLDAGRPETLAKASMFMPYVQFTPNETSRRKTTNH